MLVGSVGVGVGVGVDVGGFRTPRAVPKAGTRGFYTVCTHAMVARRD